MVRDFNAAAFWAGFSTFIWMVFGALTLQISVIQQFRLPDAEARSWICITWLSASTASLAFILRYRQPLGIGWTIPGLVYMGSIASRFTFEEFVAANLAAGAAIVVFGLMRMGSRVIHFIPLPILMAMFAGSIVGFVTNLVEASNHDAALVAPMVAAYVIGRVVNRPRIPAVGLAVVTGAVLIVALQRLGTSSVDIAPPALVIPGISYNPAAIMTVSIPMVVLVLGLGNTQGLGFLVAQGYPVPANRLTVAVGMCTVVNALFGGHPAAMTRISAAMLGGPEAGPLEGRYTGAIVTFVLALGVALATGLLVALIAVLPEEYVFAVAGLAILASFEDALGRAFSGPLRFGATVAFGVTLSTFVAAGIPSAFWALIAGIVASLLVERPELLASWRDGPS
jgi:benzoate membrane transport protein